MYILKTYDKLKLTLEDHEAAKILEAINAGQQKNILVKGNYFAIAGIASMTKQEDFEEEDHKIGVLHDGTRVIRQFGEWFCLQGDTDEKGYYAVRPDSVHYPEILMDCVPSVETYFMKYSKLPIAERKALMIAGKDAQRYQRSVEHGFSKISATPMLVAKGSTLLPSETGIADYCDEHDTFKADCPCNEQEAQNILDGEISDILEE